MPTVTITRKPLAYEASSLGSNQHVWPLELVIASDWEELPPEIFVYHAMDLQDLSTARFEAVASVSQILELGLTPYVGDTTVPFFRKKELTFACRSPQEAEELWSNIHEDIQDLVSNMSLFQDLGEGETIAIEVT
jgi:hypothetical protein